MVFARSILAVFMPLVGIASVGSHRIEEEIFGKAHDPKTVRRISSFVRPYQFKICLSVAAVLVFILLAHYAGRHVGIELGIQEMSAAKALLALDEGRADIAIDRTITISPVLRSRRSRIIAFGFWHCPIIRWPPASSRARI